MKERLFDIARRISKKSTSRYKLGCVITRRSKPLGLGYNFMQKTHSKSNHPYKFLHCEIHALIGLDFKETNKASAYVYREDRNGSMAMAKPCPTCEEALRLAGIRKIFYTTKEGYKSEIL